MTETKPKPGGENQKPNAAERTLKSVPGFDNKAVQKLLVVIVLLLVAIVAGVVVRNFIGNDNEASQQQFSDVLEKEESLIQAQQHSEVTKLWENYLDSAIDSSHKAEALSHLAVAYVNVGDNDKAIETYLELEQEQGYLDFNVALGLAYAYESQKQYDKAAEYHRKAADALENNVGELNFDDSNEAVRKYNINYSRKKAASLEKMSR